MAMHNNSDDIQFIKEVKNPGRVLRCVQNDVIFLGEQPATSNIILRPRKKNNLLNDLNNYVLEDDVIIVSDDVNNVKTVATNRSNSIINDLSNYDPESLLELVNSRASSSQASISLERLKQMSPVDPSLETLDPLPNLHTLFQDFDERYFECKLTRFHPIEVSWANTTASWAGVFIYGSQNVQLKMNINMLKYRTRRDIVNTLLHEMIHAYIFICQIRDTSAHGRKFQQIMRNINEIAGTDITVTHNFIEEANHIRIQARGSNQRR